MIRHRVPSGRFKQTRTCPILIVVAVALVLAMPVAAWWLVGALGTTPAPGGSRHALRPWPISPAEGMAATIVAAVSVIFLIWPTARRWVDPRWCRVLLPLLAAGFVAGAGWRVLVAGAPGAGFVGFLGGPLVLILVAWALGYAFWLGGGQSPPGPEGPPPDLLSWAQIVDVSRVTDHTVRAAEEYLRDGSRMTALAGRESGLRVVSLLETQVCPPPPPSLSPSDIAAAVLAVRRNQLGIEDWPGWANWPGRSDWSAWADWPGWNRNRPASPQ